MRAPRWGPHDVTGALGACPSGSVGRPRKYKNRSECDRAYKRRRREWARIRQEIRGRLHGAARGHVEPELNVEPIRCLLDRGCDLEADILPTVARTVPELTRPLKRWAAAFGERESPGAYRWPACRSVVRGAVLGPMSAAYRWSACPGYDGSRGRNLDRLRKMQAISPKNGATHPLPASPVSIRAPPRDPCDASDRAYRERRKQREKTAGEFPEAAVARARSGPRSAAHRP
jgi:hypothetical protein